MVENRTPNILTAPRMERRIGGYTYGETRTELDLTGAVEFLDADLLARPQAAYARRIGKLGAPEAALGRSES